jgi:hypothetical protein
MTNFNSWIDKQTPELQTLNKVPMEKVHSTLISVHSLLQEVAEKQPAMSTMYEELKTISSNASPNEMSRLKDQFSKIQKSFQVNI